MPPIAAASAPPASVLYAVPASSLMVLLEIEPSDIAPGLRADLRSELRVSLIAAFSIPQAQFDAPTDRRGSALLIVTESDVEGLIEGADVEKTKSARRIRLVSFQPEPMSGSPATPPPYCPCIMRASGPRPGKGDADRRLEPGVRGRSELFSWFASKDRSPRSPIRALPKWKAPARSCLCRSSTERRCFQNSRARQS